MLTDGDMLREIYRLLERDARKDARMQKRAVLPGDAASAAAAARETVCPHPTSSRPHPAAYPPPRPLCDPAAGHRRALTTHTVAHLQRTVSVFVPLGQVDVEVESDDSAPNDTPKGVEVQAVVADSGSSAKGADPDPMKQQVQWLANAETSTKSRHRLHGPGRV